MCGVWTIDLYVFISASCKLGIEKGNLDMIKRYHQHFSDAIELLENSDRDAFIKRFESVTDWMGDYSKLFLDESRVMLQQAHDNRHYEEK